MSNKMGEAMEKLVEEKFKESGLKFWYVCVYIC
jgi:hypothetical protein